MVGGAIQNWDPTELRIPSPLPILDLDSESSSNQTVRLLINELHCKEGVECVHVYIASIDDNDCGVLVVTGLLCSSCSSVQLCVVHLYE